MFRFLRLGQWDPFQVLFCILLTDHLYHFSDLSVLGNKETKIISHLPSSFPARALKQLLRIPVSFQWECIRSLLVLWHSLPGYLNDRLAWSHSRLFIPVHCLPTSWTSSPCLCCLQHINYLYHYGHPSTFLGFDIFNQLPPYPSSYSSHALQLTLKAPCTHIL